VRWWISASKRCSTPTYSPPSCRTCCPASSKTVFASGLNGSSPTRGPLPLPHALRDRGPYRVRAGAERGKRLTSQPVRLVDQREQEMLGPHSIMVERHGLVVRVRDDPPGPHREPAERRHRRSPCQPPDTPTRLTRSLASPKSTVASGVS
jgi:hypothetical protein